MDGAAATTKKKKRKRAPGSPGARPQPAPSPAGSPSAPTPRALGPGSPGPPSPLALPPSMVEAEAEAAAGSSTTASSSATPVAAEGGSKPVSMAPVPDGPPAATRELLASETGIGIDESYSKDEEALNTFLRLHPMLSAEACSQRSLHVMAGMLEKATMGAGQLPVVPKSHDDAFLRPPNEVIGERACLNGDRCLARFIAQLRYGPGTRYAFTMTEFLLPDQQQAFLNGKGLPQRRGKCLLCTRYFQNYTYILARSDPSFEAGKTGMGLQVYCNAVGPSDDAAGAAVHDDAQLKQAAAELPTNASPVSCRDGYKPAAMLFVDEEFANMRTAREGNLGKLLFRPVVRFHSSDYRYVLEDDEPRIVQVGIGADEHTNGLGFRQPASAGGPAPAASKSPRR